MPLFQLGSLSGKVIAFLDARLQLFAIGALTITARLPPGHSPGGLTYGVEGLKPTLAVIVDAPFASSMGGVPPDHYAAALRPGLVRRKPA